jgi:hypothetical protein
MGPGAFAFTFTIGGGIVCPGCGGMGMEENEKANGRGERTQEQAYGPIAFHNRETKVHNNLLRGGKK